MKHVVLGTAGHIDHGKTALVKALTGVDTDRLKEEKERGITTELGFAFLNLPSGTRLGIVDVPGHEKFVKHMVAGAWGIDLVALVIASDEGVMPQTREHLEICSLLRVKKGLVVLSKTDLIDRELLDLVREEIKETAKDTFLRDSPILPVSAMTGEGISDLVATLDRLSNDVEERSSEGLFRMPVDRIFTMKGFGAVVTGTMVRGSLSVGETVEVLPGGGRGKVRGLQVYNRPVERAYAGERTAVNLQGVETANLDRGNVLIRPGTLVATQCVDAYLEYLPRAFRPLKHRAKVRFHIGTNLTIGSPYLLDRDEVPPGEGGYVQFRLDRPIVALPQDRFVIRDVSAVQTLGGGVILDIFPSKHKRHAPSVLQDLTLLRNGSEKEVLRQHILRSGAGGIHLEDLSRRISIPGKEMERFLKEMMGRGEILVIDAEKMKVIDQRVCLQLKERVIEQVKEFHQKFPMKSGLAKEELRTKLPPETEIRLFQMLLGELIQSKQVVLEKDKVKLPGHQIGSADEKGLVKSLEGTMKKSDLQPPSPKELADQWSASEQEVQAILEHLVHEGVLVKIKAGMYFHSEPVERLRESLIQHLKRNREITTPEFKEMTGVSRKYAIPLIEYFDQTRLTLRLGDKRVLRTASQAVGSKSA